MAARLAVADLAPPGANGVTVRAYRTLSDVGYIVGPALLGFLADAYGAGAALVTIGVLFWVAGILFGLFAPRRALSPSPSAPPPTIRRRTHRRGAERRRGAENRNG